MVSFAEKQRRKRKQELDESFDAFDYGSLDRDDLGTVVDEVDDTGLMGPAGASTFFSNQQRKARDAHEERSAGAQRTDESMKATLTTNFNEWESDPTDFDFPGVDTPAGMDFDDEF